MKRPLAVIGFSMLFTSVVLTYFSTKMAIALLLSATVIFLLSFLLTKRSVSQAIRYIAFAIALSTISLLAVQYKYVSVLSYAEKDFTIKGVVCNQVSTSNYHSYLVKVKEVDGKKCNFNISVISEDKPNYTSGDYVEGKVLFEDVAHSSELLEYSLSRKALLTTFHSDTHFLQKAEGKNYFYYYIEQVKNVFTDTTLEYIPGESGGIANAMVIGDRSNISDFTYNTFSYSGTSHLLVISGLHLTVVAMGVINLMSKTSKLRKYRIPVAITILVLYSALTGLSPSVLRAGVMVGAVILGKLFNKSADSINSIGGSLILILLYNPFDVCAASLWLTLLSTLGILLLSPKVNAWIYNTPFAQQYTDLPLFSFITNTFSISFSSTVFTLPVIIYTFKMLPTLSFISNLLMVEISFVLMITTVLGFIFDLMGFSFLARSVYFLSGGIGNFLKSVAVNIGLSDKSSIPLSHKYFEYFLLFAIAIITITLIIKRHGKNLLKPMVILLTVIFLLTSLYCTSYEINTPSFDVILSNDEMAILVNSGYSHYSFGSVSKNSVHNMRNALSIHNSKALDGVVSINSPVADIAMMQELWAAGDSIDYSSQNNTFIIENKVKVEISNAGNSFEITTNEATALILKKGMTQNLLEIHKNYDIILVHYEDYVKIGNILPDNCDFYGEGVTTIYIKNRS